MKTVQPLSAEQIAARKLLQRDVNDARKYLDGIRSEFDKVSLALYQYEEALKEPLREAKPSHLVTFSECGKYMIGE